MQRVEELTSLSSKCALDFGAEDQGIRNVKEAESCA